MGPHFKIVTTKPKFGCVCTQILQHFLMACTSSYYYFNNIEVQQGKVVQVVVAVHFFIMFTPFAAIFIDKELVLQVTSGHFRVLTNTN